jgi:ParB family chromosome partitioning protein
LEKRKGIRSLIPTGTLSESPEESIREVLISLITPNPYQPRARVDDEGLTELAESIKTHGILQPLLVRRSGKEYQLIAGERRFRAAVRAGLMRVPVVIREAEDRQVLEIALVENLQREDINPMEAAQAYRRLMDEFGLTQEQLGARVGKSRSAVANTLRLLSLPESVQNTLREGRIEEGHGKVLASIEDHRLVMQLWRRIIKRGLSVKQTAELATKLMTRIVPRGTMLGKAKKGIPLPPNLLWLQDQMTERLGCRVRLRLGKLRTGVVEIHYADDEDLERVYEVITGEAITFGAREARRMQEAIDRGEGSLGPLTEPGSSPNQNR